MPIVVLLLTLLAAGCSAPPAAVPEPPPSTLRIGGTDVALDLVKVRATLLRPDLQAVSVDAGGDAELHLVLLGKPEGREFRYLRPADRQGEGDSWIRWKDRHFDAQELRIAVETAEGVARLRLQGTLVGGVPVEADMATLLPKVRGPALRGTPPGPGESSPRR